VTIPYRILALTLTASALCCAGLMLVLVAARA